MPISGAQGVPKLFKLMATLALTVIIAPVVPQATAPTMNLLVFGMVGEVLLGVLIGGVVRMAFGALHLGGELIGTQIGHGAAMMFDPTIKVQGSPLGTLASLLAGLVYLGADLHLALLVAVGDSFDKVLPGQVISPLVAGGVWIETAGVVIEAGLRISSPVLAIVFLVNLFVAVLTRLAPSMNVFFSLGLILTLLAGLWVFYLCLPYLLPLHADLILQMMDRIPQMLDQSGGI